MCIRDSSFPVLLVHFRAFSFVVIFYLVIVVSVFVLLSISSGSFNSECLGGWGRGGVAVIPLLVPSSSSGFVLVSIS